MDSPQPTARSLALDILLAWRDQRNPPPVPERDDPVWAALIPRDRAFAYDLVTGIIRWRNLLDAVLASRLKQPISQLEPKVRSILWLGGFQLLLHTGSPPYASVHTSVELAKQAGAERAAGLINAVLRGITRLNPGIEPRGAFSIFTFPRDFATQTRFVEPVFPDPAADLPLHLSIITSHPVELVQMLLKAHGQEVATGILIHNNLRPLIVLRADDPAFSPPPGSGLAPHEFPGFFVATHGWNAPVADLVAAGQLSPQDATSGRVVRALVEHMRAAHLADQPNLQVLDLCAGLGTKTLQLARAFPNAAITACDIDAAKLERLSARRTQMKITSVKNQPSASVTPELFSGSAAFSVALVDAPCSNTGVMNRRVQSRWRWPGLDRAVLAKLQLDLLTQASAVLVPGGILVYSTCSVDPSENQAVVDRFLAANTRWKLLAQQTTLPPQTSEPTQRCDGGYYAILQG